MTYENNPEVLKPGDFEEKIETNEVSSNHDSTPEWANKIASAITAPTRRRPPLISINIRTPHLVVGAVVGYLIWKAAKKG